MQGQVHGGHTDESHTHGRHAYAGHADGGHAHGGHTHGISPLADRRKLEITLGLVLGFLAVEIVGGVLAHSLALLSDAGHMLADACAIGISLVAIRLARRPAGGALTFGLRRVEILSAQFNGALLLVLGVLIVVAAIGRLLSPPQTRGWLMLAVALLGIVVNVVAASMLARADRRSMNVEGSFQHVLTDLYAFIGTAIAAVVILSTGFVRSDAIASLVVAALMLRSAYRLLRDSGRVFLEAAPPGLDPDQIGHTMVAQPDVAEVHDLHVWEVSSGFPALSAHVLVKDGCDCHAVRRRLEELLVERFELDHTTLQVEHVGRELLQIHGIAPRHSAGQAQQ
jgi:cobalt-zinc-cadmium efflux system protein